MCWSKRVQLPDSCWECPSCFGGTLLSAWRTWLLGTAGSVYHWTENKEKSREAIQSPGWRPTKREKKTMKWGGFNQCCTKFAFYLKESGFTLSPSISERCLSLLLQANMKEKKRCLTEADKSFQAQRKPYSERHTAGGFWTFAPFPANITTPFRLNI